MYVFTYFLTTGNCSAGHFCCSVSFFSLDTLELENMRKSLIEYCSSLIAIV